MLEVNKKLDKEAKLLNEIDDRIRRRMLQTSNRGPITSRKKARYRSRLTIRGKEVI